MRHIRLFIEYDGSEYHGWQSQKSVKTVEDILRENIFEITGDRTKITGASRTDAGVHALGQVAVFGTRSRLPVETVVRALNAKLPQDIRIMNAEETNETFNPRYSSTRKKYFYLISTGKLQSAFLYRYMWNLKTDLDLSAMESAAVFLKGEHDFSAFRGSGCGAKTPVRTIYTLNITEETKIDFMTARMNGHFLKISIDANAFLRHMVRNIVGTLVETGRGIKHPDSIKEILSSRDRRLAGATAPAHALFLEEVTY